MSASRNLLFLILVLWASILLGAEHHGEVKSSGLPVPGATVTATQGDKTVVATTDNLGVYSFADLAVGSWLIEVNMPGFTKLSREVDVSAAAPGTEWNLALLSPDGAAPGEENVQQAAARPDLGSEENEPEAAAEAPRSPPTRTP